MAVSTMSVREARLPESAGRLVRLQGWVRTRRDSKGGFSFLELNDGSCLGNVQVIADGDAAQLRERDQDISRPVASVTVTGEVQASPAKGQPTEVQAAGVIVHGWADPETYPLQKKGHSFEFLRTHGPSAAAHQHLRRRRPRAQLRLPVDPRFLPGTGLSLRPPADHHRQRLRRGRPDVPGHHARPRPSCRATRRASISARTSSHRPTYLTVSGQLEAEIFACALGKVYTFGPTFRAENSNTSRHLAEFWMVEPEMAFYDLTDNMDLAEAFLKRIIRDVLERCAEDMQFFKERIDKAVIDRLEQRAQQRVRAPAVHRGGRHPAEIGQDVRVPGRLGQRPAGGARALPDREALQEAGDPVRLSADASSRSTCASTTTARRCGRWTCWCRASARSSAAASARSGWTCWKSA